MPTPNTIKYSTATQSLSIKKGNFYLGVSDLDYGPTLDTGYWSGINPSTNGYTVYINKSEGGPSIYTPISSDELISLINSIYSQQFTALGDLITWSNTQSDLLIVDRVYPNMTTQDLVLYFDSYITSNFTFTRNGSAKYTYTDGSLRSVSANQIRYKYKQNGQIDGLLVEPPKTNHYLWSEQFEDGFWLKSDALGTRVEITPNATISPLGDLTADLLVPSTLPNAEHPMRANSTIMLQSLFTASYTWSIYAKAAGYDYFALRTNVNNQWSAAIFDLSNGTTFSVSSNYIKHGIQSVGNDWYRVWVTATNSTTTSLQHISTPDGSISFTGNGTSGCYIWGAQFETGNNLTSYITTTASTVLRPSDLVQSPLLNYSTTQWSIFFEIEYLLDFLADTADVSASPLVWYFRRLGTSSVNFWNQNAQQNLGSFFFSANSVRRFRAMMVFNGSTISTFVNGTKVGNQITPTNLSPYTNFFSSNQNRVVSTKAGLGLGFDTDHIVRSFNLYTRSFSDSEAINLTTL